MIDRIASELIGASFLPDETPAEPVHWLLPRCGGRRRSPFAIGYSPKARRWDFAISSATIQTPERGRRPP